MAFLPLVGLPLHPSFSSLLSQSYESRGKRVGKPAKEIQVQESQKHSASVSV